MKIHNRKSFCQSDDHLFIALRFAFVALLAICVVSPIQAQDRDRGRNREFDMIRYLDRADRDDDGMLSERELGGRMGEYVKTLGIDISKPVKISKIKSTYAKSQEAKQNAEHMAEIDKNRRVPKFGTDDELAPPPNFAVSTAESGAGRLEDQYEKEMVDTVRAYMKRYDENKDGWLDNNEAQRVKRVLGDNADKDGNGKLGELEIAQALTERAESNDRGGWDRGRRGRDGGSDRGRRGRDSGDRSSRDRRSESSSSSRSFTGAKTPAPGSSSKSQPTRSGRPISGRNNSYVDGLFTRYDKDKNGTLDSKERKEISGALKLVDVNGDGEIDRREALDSINGTAKAPEKTESTSSRSSGRRSRRDRGSDDKKRSASDERDSERPSRSRRSSSSGNDKMRAEIKGFQNVPLQQEKITELETILRRAGADDAFFEFDKNKDGLISMGEFRDGRQWTDELVSEFQKLDEDDNGRVSVEEFEENYDD